MDIRSILRPIGIFYGLWVYFVAIWYIFTHFGMLYQENLATLLETKKSEKMNTFLPGTNLTANFLITSGNVKSISS
jgi:hypothetical protein